MSIAGSNVITETIQKKIPNAHTLPKLAIIGSGANTSARKPTTVVAVVTITAVPVLTTAVSTA